MTGRKDEMATCPYCGKAVVLDGANSEKDEEVRKEVKGKLKKEVMYYCPHCNRILGFGFFFGGWGTGRP
jgi:predicted  nucleic acid-binding Zn-ribbon protein